MMPRYLAGLLVLSLLVWMPAIAQDQDEAYDLYGQDVSTEEGVTYARLRYLDGGATLLRDDVIREDVIANDPIIPGDRFTTYDGRAEIQLTDGSLLRLDLDTEVVVLGLSDSANQIENATVLQLLAGSLIVRTDQLDSHIVRFQIDTDAGSVFLLSEGLYGIDVRDDGRTVVAVRRGAAEVMAEEISTIVRSGERTIVRPGQIPAEPQVFNTLRRDAFDQWSLERDGLLVLRETDERRIPPGLPEPVEPYASELAIYGTWISTPSYGWVWRPVSVAYDWRPYHHGRWVYSPAGLVWVSYEPWGWAPYHYGRWEFIVGSGWVWVPGHVYAGAHVAWSYSPGYFGWCPLGYYDYPVRISIRIGHHHSPWVYVRGHHLYARHVETHVVKETTIIREIERRRVVVRTGPRIDPKRIARSPRIADDVYRKVKQRRDLQIRQDPDVKRRVPFHEKERQELVRKNMRRVREGERRGLRTVGRGRSGRPATLAPNRRDVNVRRGTRPDSDDDKTRISPRRRTVRPGDEERPNRGRTRTPAAERQERDRAQRETPRSGDTVPERVLPRIVPRRGAPKATGPQRGSTKQRPRRESSDPAVRKPADSSSRSGAQRATPRSRRPDADRAPVRGGGSAGASKAKPRSSTTTRPRVKTTPPARSGAPKARSGSSSRSGSRKAVRPRGSSGDARKKVSPPARKSGSGGKKAVKPGGGKKKPSGKKKSEGKKDRDR